MLSNSTKTERFGIPPKEKEVFPTFRSRFDKKQKIVFISAPVTVQSHKTAAADKDKRNAVSISPGAVKDTEFLSLFWNRNKGAIAR